MDAVYSNASQVLIYLGCREPSVISGFLGYLDKISRGIITRDPWIARSTLDELLQHPYFNRVWVLQEISLAKLVALCTDLKTIHWDARTVRELMILCDRHNYDPPGVLHWLPATQLNEYDCLDLLHRARRCMATDPRDKVFALYGFLPLSFREALPINYATSIEEVYCNIATHLISTTKRLDVLKHVPPHQPLDLDNMPSWVPAWDIRQSIDMQLPGFTGAQMKRFAAFGSSPLSMSRSSNAEVQPTAIHTTHDDHQMQLGSRYDSIVWYRKQETNDHRSTLAKVHGMRLSAIPCLRVRGYLLDKVITPILLGSYSEPKITPFLRPRVCRSCGNDAGWTSSNEISSDKLWDFQWRQLTSLADVIASLPGGQEDWKTQQSMKFVSFKPTPSFGLSQRRVGRSVKPGDTIWAIEGLDVPVVLRRRIQDGEAHYNFIGKCYFHGAGPKHECPTCGTSTEPWLMEYATIDIR